MAEQWLILEAIIYYFPAVFANIGIFLTWFFSGKKVFLIVSKKWFGTHRGYDAFFYGIFYGGIGGLIIGNFWLGFVQGLGVWLGNLFGSFVKRRLNIPPGEEMPILDQIDFLLGATIVGSFVLKPSLQWFLLIVVLASVFHRIASYFLFKMGMKDVPY